MAAVVAMPECKWLPSAQHSRSSQMLSRGPPERVLGGGVTKGAKRLQESDDGGDGVRRPQRRQRARIRRHQ